MKRPNNRNRLKCFAISISVKAEGMVKVKIHAETKEEALEELRKTRVSDWEFDGEEFLNIADYSTDEDVDELDETDVEEVR